MRRRWLESPGGEAVDADAWDRADALGLPRTCESAAWSRPAGRDEMACALHGLTVAEHDTLI
ncbi:hypothetical protein [Mycobacterium lehmannii]|uniref:hypothetical protein n=1 Tax=Mycobacterium lehmannii TaxID=2048550 RepID=UPI000B944382|nr:hypothetical protein [Mycobacterium lehmannii]